MKIMVTGSGGREHALAFKLARSESVERVYVAPGNGGTALEPDMENVPVDAMDFEAQIRFAKDNHIDLTIIGPEGPLVAGAVDAFAAAGLNCFGPSKLAAQLEGSKSFTKRFLQKYNIPTAAYGAFSDLDEALAYLAQQDLPIVIKADGLAAGKGVFIATSREEAVETVRDMMSGNILGGVGNTVVIEDFLTGEEASFIVIADGRTAIPFASSQDHKTAFDGDIGPNTGGMGAYSPAPVVTQAVHKRIMDEVIDPTIRGMAAEGIPYTGFLYAGLMIDDAGNPKVIEFNCRFGDPETQPVMARMRSDLVDLCMAAITGDLSGRTIEFDERTALTVVMASGGYPGTYMSNKVITGLDQFADPDLFDRSGIKVFHAGTRRRGELIVTDGGRVLGVTALGPSVFEAQRAAYETVYAITFEDAMFRTDIGYRAVAREKSGTA